MIQLDKKHKPFINKWVAALRSGNYSQGQGQLCKIVDGEPQFCCLGVACYLLGSNEQDMDIGRYGLPYELEKELPEFLSTGYHGFFDSILPTLNDGDMEDIDDFQYAEGINLNEFEKRKHSFSEIADIIEKHIEYV